MDLLLKNTDYLPFIPTEDILSSRNEIIERSVTILHYEGASLTASYLVDGENIKVSVKLNTALGEIELGTVKLNSDNTSFEICGGNEVYKTITDIYFDQNESDIILDSSICIPFLGCHNEKIEIDVNVPK